MKKNKDLTFLKNAIKDAQGKKTRVWYSQGNYTKISGIPESTITIYAKDYSGRIPKQLRPINESDIMTDYFATDTARVKKGNKYFKDIEKLLKKWA